MNVTKQKFITDQDVRFVVAIIVFLVPIFLCYADITKSLALIQQSLLTIKSNDLAHIEIELTDMKARNTVQDSRTIQLGLEMEKIQTTLDLLK